MLGPSWCQCHFNKNLYIFIKENAFENVVWKMAAILSRPQCVKTEVDEWYYVRQISLHAMMQTMFEKLVYDLSYHSDDAVWCRWIVLVNLTAETCCLFYFDIVIPYPQRKHQDIEVMHCWNKADSWNDGFQFNIHLYGGVMPWKHFLHYCITMTS